VPNPLAVVTLSLGTKPTYLRQAFGSNKFEGFQEPFTKFTIYKDSLQRKEISTWIQSWPKSAVPDLLIVFGDQLEEGAKISKVCPPVADNTSLNNQLYVQVFKEMLPPACFDPMFTRRRGLLVVSHSGTISTFEPLISE